MADVMHGIVRFKWFVSAARDVHADVLARESLEFAARYLEQILEGKATCKAIGSLLPTDFLTKPELLQSIERFRASFDAFGIRQLDEHFTEDEFDARINAMIGTIRDALESGEIDPARFVVVKEFFTMMFDAEMSMHGQRFQMAVV